jgi:hypothetical protein
MQDLINPFVNHRFVNCLTWQIFTAEDTSTTNLDILLQNNEIIDGTDPIFINSSELIETSLQAKQLLALELGFDTTSDIYEIRLFENTYNFIAKKHILKLVKRVNPYGYEKNMTEEYYRVLTNSKYLEENNNKMFLYKVK